MQREDFFSLSNAIRFNWQYSRATSRLLRTNEFNIVHHVLPFAIATTYNLSWLLARDISQPKLVLGPVQAPFDIRDDEFVGVLRSRMIRPIRRVMGPILSSLSSKTILRANRIIAVNQRSKERLVEACAL